LVRVTDGPSDYKGKIVRAVEDLPEDATIEDAIERLLFLHKIEIGLGQTEEGKTVPLDEVEARLKRRRANENCSRENT
jgi:predicted transcriptional regulator